jgi:hypothetical protein
MGQTVKGGRIDRKAFKPVVGTDPSKAKPAMKNSDTFPARGVKSREEAMQNVSERARLVAKAKTELRARARAEGRPANFDIGLSAIGSKSKTRKLPKPPFSGLRGDPKAVATYIDGKRVN